jgi:hypothetical protein
MCGLLDVIEEIESDGYRCHQAWVVVRPTTPDP